ncbi:MAG TPA: hypothetical protein VEU31_09335 [Candidatus Acidoferrales bacterium]|nr:hypothetical protein [Candidatus Acidoferrales bacterium]
MRFLLKYASFMVGSVAAQVLLLAILCISEFLWFDRGPFAAIFSLAAGLLLIVGYFYGLVRLLTRLWPGKGVSDGFAALMLFAGLGISTGLAAWSGGHWQTFLARRFVSPPALQVFGQDAADYLLSSFPRNIPKYIASEARAAIVDFDSTARYPVTWKDGPVCSVQQGDGVVSLEKVLFPTSALLPFKEIRAHAPSYPVFWHHSIEAYYRSMRLTATVEPPKDLQSILVIRGHLRLPILYAKETEPAVYSNVGATTDDVIDVLLLPRQYETRAVDRLLSQARTVPDFIGIAKIALLVFGCASFALVSFLHFGLNHRFNPSSQRWEIREVP